MKERSVYSMRIAKYGYILISAVFCLAGIGLIMSPTPAETTLGTFFGVTMIVFGMVKLVGYYSKDLFRLAFQYDFQFGVLLILLGIITLVNPGNVIHFLAVSFGICVIAECLFKGKIAMEAKAFGIREWWLTLGFSILTGIAGLVLVFRPAQAARTIIVLLGIALLTEGILNISIACSLVKIVKHQKPDSFDVDYYEV